MSKALEYLKAALLIALSFVVLAFIVCNFQGLGLAMERLIERASVRSINIFGTEVGFDQSRVNWVLPFDYLTDDDKNNVQNLINGLTEQEFVRLMWVSEINNNKACDFEKPTTKMQKDLTLDHELRKKRLITKVEAEPKVLESVRADQAKAIEQRKPWDIGSPLKCYEITLTNIGHDVKTALVNSFSVAFDGGQTATPQSTGPGGAK